MSTLDKLAYTGMCMLDLSSPLMYDFHHGYIKNSYGDKAMLLFAGTDSLVHKIKSHDMFEEKWKLKQNMLQL